MERYSFMVAYGELLGLSPEVIEQRVKSASTSNAPWTAVCRHESEEGWATIGYVYPVELRDKIIYRSEELYPLTNGEEESAP